MSGGGVIEVLAILILADFSSFAKRTIGAVVLAPADRSFEDRLCDSDFLCEVSSVVVL